MNDINFTAHDYVIGGKMVVGQVVISGSDFSMLASTKDEIKRRLLAQMMEFILENKLAEFTMSEDHARDTRTFRVRAYLAPNDQVKVLRTAYKVD
jgi:hypothetical protein